MNKKHVFAETDQLYLIGHALNENPSSKNFELDFDTNLSSSDKIDDHPNDRALKYS